MKQITMDFDTYLKELRDDYNSGYTFAFKNSMSKLMEFYDDDKSWDSFLSIYGELYKIAWPVWVMFGDKSTKPEGAE